MTPREIAGYKREDLFDDPPLFDTEISQIMDDIQFEEDKAFAIACFKVNVDPEVVKKQADLINRLRAALKTFTDGFAHQLTTSAMPIKIEVDETWYPVDDILPPNGKDVLVLTDKGDIFVGNYNSCKLPMSHDTIGWGFANHLYKFDFTQQKVTHWKFIKGVKKEAR